MPRTDYVTCRECGRHKAECGELSHTRLCAECAERLLRAAALDIAHRSGRFYVRWRRGMVAYVVNELLDEAAMRAKNHG